MNVQTNFKYNGDVNAGLENNPEQDIQSTFFLNARASYYFGAEEQYELSLWADNITEEKVCLLKRTLDSLNYQFTCIPNPGIAFYGATFSVQF